MDKCTAAGKPQEELKAKFIQILIKDKAQANYFNTSIDYILSCVDVNQQEYIAEESKNASKFLKIHDTFISKILFLQDIIKTLPPNPSKLFTYIISHKGFPELINKLAFNGHLCLRIKAYDILDACLKICMSEASNKSIITYEKAKITQICFNLIKPSLEQTDCYLHFYSLILIDNIFQNILLVPQFDDEVKCVSNPSEKSITDILDIETANLEKFQDISIADINYLHMRILIVLKLWPLLQNMLNSNWSNIRSITYGLFCSMLKISLSTYKHSYQTKLKALLLPLINSLLASKESESKAGGLNILGSFCGLSYDLSLTKLKIVENIEFFKKNSAHISLPIWQSVFDMQDDWDFTIKEASTVLIQLCAPKDPIKHFMVVSNESSILKTKTYLSKIGSFHKHTQIQPSSFISDDLREDSCDMCEPQSCQKEYNNYLITDLNSDSSEEPSKEVEDYFYLEKLPDEQIKDIVSIFRNDFKPPKSLWIDKDNLVQDEFVVVKETERNERALMDMYEEKIVSGSKPLAKPNPVVELIPEESVKHERKEERKTDSIDAEPYKFLNNDEDITNEDLGIIDADEDELYMNFDDAPVLKNAYKKHKGNSKKIEQPKVTPSAATRPENGIRPCTPPMKITEEPKDTEIMFDAIKESNKIMQANVTRLKQDLELPQKPSTNITPSVQISLSNVNKTIEKEEETKQEELIEESKDDTILNLATNDKLEVINGKKKLNKSFEQSIGATIKHKKNDANKTMSSKSPPLLSFNSDDINGLLQGLEKNKFSSIPRTPNYSTDHSSFEENRIRPAKQSSKQRIGSNPSHSSYASKAKAKSKDKNRMQSDILSQTSPNVNVSLKKMKGNKSFTIESQSDRSQMKVEDKVKIIKGIYAFNKKENAGEGKKSPPPIQRYSAMESKQPTKKHEHTKCLNSAGVIESSQTY